MTIPVDLKPIDELVERLTEMSCCRRKACRDAADNAKSTIEAQASLICEAIETGTHALRELDCLAACIYHDDQRQEVQAFADKFRATLSQLKGES